MSILIDLIDVSITPILVFFDNAIDNINIRDKFLMKRILSIFLHLVLFILLSTIMGFFVYTMLMIVFAISRDSQQNEITLYVTGYISTSLFFFAVFCLRYMGDIVRHDVNIAKDIIYSSVIVIWIYKSKKLQKIGTTLIIYTLVFGILFSIFIFSISDITGLLEAASNYPGGRNGLFILLLIIAFCVSFFIINAKSVDVIATALRRLVLWLIVTIPMMVASIVLIYSEINRGLSVSTWVGIGLAMFSLISFLTGIPSNWSTLSSEILYEYKTDIDRNLDQAYLKYSFDSNKYHLSKRIRMFIDTIYRMWKEGRKIRVAIFFIFTFLWLFYYRKIVWLMVSLVEYIQKWIEIGIDATYVFWIKQFNGNVDIGNTVLVIIFLSMFCLRLMYTMAIGIVQRDTKKVVSCLWLLIMLIGSIVIFSIITFGNTNSILFSRFFLVWITVLFLIWGFEKIVNWLKCRNMS